MEIILLNYKNNYIERLNIDDNVAKSFNIVAINLNVLHYYFECSNEIIFKSVNFN